MDGGGCGQRGGAHLPGGGVAARGELGLTAEAARALAGLRPSRPGACWQGCALGMCCARRWYVHASVIWAAVHLASPRRSSLHPECRPCCHPLSCSTTWRGCGAAAGGPTSAASSPRRRCTRWTACARSGSTPSLAGLLVGLWCNMMRCALARHRKPMCNQTLDASTSGQVAAVAVVVHTLI